MFVRLFYIIVMSFSLQFGVKIRVITAFETVANNRLPSHVVAGGL